VRVKTEGTEPEIAQGALVPEDEVASTSVEIRPNDLSAVAVIDRRALEEQLEERYPKAEDRAAFINWSVELAQEALAQAWALRRLRHRYGAETVAQLSVVKTDS
jgi:hypothetical protein